MAGRFPLVPLPQDLESRYRLAGLLPDGSVSLLVDRHCRRWPWLPALADRGVRLSWGELGAEVRGLAGGLRAAGVGRGDVVCWQTPNWWEAVAVHLAAWQIGAVSVPVVPIYRRHEMAHILGQLRPEAVVSVGSFRGCAHAEILDGVLDEIGHVPKVKMVLREETPGWRTFAEIKRAGAAFPGDPDPLSPDDACLVLYTSGTTSAPKGAIHTCRSLLAETLQMADGWGIGWEDVAYMPVPLQHITGVLLGITVPLLRGGSTVLAERWDAEAAVDDLEEFGVTFSAGATLFVDELVGALRRRGRGPGRLRLYACGGAAVPPVVMERAEAIGLPTFRIYGMTELPTVTMPNRADPFDVRVHTDGPLAPGVECEAVDGERRPLPDGNEGELRVRGPERMAGYVDPAHNDVLDGDGWFYTGDVGIVEAGCVRVTGRIKDIINRGGEKFATREVEDLLDAHPGVAASAVVPGPDRRYGEVPVAFLVPRSPGAPPAEDELRGYLEGRGIARQKVPTRFVVVDDLPRTASGKIQKFVLVQRLLAGGSEDV